MKKLLLIFVLMSKNSWSEDLKGGNKKNHFDNRNYIVLSKLTTREENSNRKWNYETLDLISSSNSAGIIFSVCNKH